MREGDSPISLHREFFHSCSLFLFETMELIDLPSEVGDMKLLPVDLVEELVVDGFVFRFGFRGSASPREGGRGGERRWGDGTR
jgi:hypothetical protein